MLHILKYSFLSKFRNWQEVFWPLFFPLILGTLFYVSFGNIEEADFETVETALVPGTNEVFAEFLEKLEESDPDLLNVSEMTAEDAERALSELEISGYYTAEETPSLTVASSGLPESILQSVLESYTSGTYTAEQILKTHPESLSTALQQLYDREELVSQVSLGGRNTNSMNQFFYALVAMACMYGSFIGFGAVLGLQANLTAVAARKGVSATGKLKLISAELISSFSIHFLNVLILLFYLKILGMSFDGKTGPMLLLSFLGALLGVCLGIFIGSIGKFREEIKIAILLAVSMFCSFLAGLMSDSVKHAVDRSFPLVNQINPAGCISDALYCINIYEDSARLSRNLLILGVEAGILFILSFLCIRRNRYDSI